MSYTIEKISKIIKAQYVGSAPDVKILRLLTDSRSLSFPDETLFFAIVTRHGDGHNYVDELYRRGVTGLMRKKPGMVMATPRITVKRMSREK